MKRTLLTFASLALLGAALSACGGGGGNTTVVAPPPPKFSAQFGANFSTDFQASNNSEPAAIAPGDIIPVSPTAEPVPFPG
jgi:hypothetical protein